MPFDKLYAKEIRWHPDGECAMLIGQQGFCVVVPEEGMTETEQTHYLSSASVQEEHLMA